MQSRVAGRTRNGLSTAAAAVAAEGHAQPGAAARAETPPATPILDRCSPLPAAPNVAGYLERTDRLLGDWCLLAGVSPEAARLWRGLLAPLAALPPASAWRAASSLCADGSPVEICEQLGPRPGGLAYTYDPGPYTAAPAVRLDAALDRAMWAAGAFPASPFPALLPAWRRCLYPPDLAPGTPTLWLGAEHTPGTPAGLKLYFNLNPRTLAGVAERAQAALALAGCAPDSVAQAVMASLATAGRPTMLAFSLAPSGRVSAKLYYRLARVDLATIAAVAGLAGLPAAPFTAYVRRMLGRSAGWIDGRAGLGLALAPGGTVAGLALYHYVRPYFVDDAELRAGVLAVAPSFGWDSLGYRRSSRLVDAGPGTRLRSLLGFAVAASGETGLRLYARTGYLAGIPAPGAVPPGGRR